MLTVPGHSKLFLYRQPINIGKSFEGLGILVQKLFPNQLLSGAFFVFLSRKKNHMKVLYWDGDGFVIVFKRLEKGAFNAKAAGDALISRREFLMLLEGVTPRHIQRRFSL